jgi:hypothetical protein
VTIKITLFGWVLIQCIVGLRGYLFDDGEKVVIIIVLSPRRSVCAEAVVPRENGKPAYTSVYKHTFTMNTPDASRCQARHPERTSSPREGAWYISCASTLHVALQVLSSQGEDSTEVFSGNESEIEEISYFELSGYTTLVLV